MNRSARRLLSVAVLAPTVTAVAVATAPAYAAPAPAYTAPGPSTTLLYETAAAAAPVTRTLPAPVLRTVGPTAEQATTTVDGALRTTAVSPDLRSANGPHCTLNPGKTVKSHTGVALPKTGLPSLGKAAPGGLAKGDCLVGHRRSGKDPLPVHVTAATKATKKVLKSVGKVGKTVRGSKLGRVPAVKGVRGVLPSARHAAVPVGSPLPDVPPVLGVPRTGEVSDLTSTLSAVPSAGRHAHPAPPDDVLGQANDAVNQTGTGVDQVTGLAKVPGLG